MKYPGSFILNEYGTNKELAKTYGVSERTIYRWKSKAKTETGARSKRPTRPRVSTLQKFKGTRKELAKKYGVSERTAYRWLAQASEKGADIPTRQKKSTYPGAEILAENAKNKDLAAKYGVSERTIQRWKRRAFTEIEEPFEVLPPDAEEIGEPFEVKPLEDEIEEPFEIPDIDLPGYDDNEIYNLTEISDLLTGGDMPILDDGSLFYNLNPNERLQYIDAYLRFQYSNNRNLFYDKNNHEMAFDPDNPEMTSPSYIASLEIWGDEFEEWLQWQQDAAQIEI